MFDGFIHPLFAWGALAASVPLLIHLLNRQRHRPMEWAAMRFVLAAYKRTRRRAQLENLLLLLLRMAAVALLALAIARPFTGDDSPLSPLTENRRDLVLVLDDSASTGYRESVQSVHEAILERAREILEEFDGTRGDRVRLIAAAGRARVVSARSPEDALSSLSTLSEPTDEALDLAALVGEILALAEDESAGTDASALEVRVLTDLQRNSFAPRDEAVAEADADTADEAADDAGDEVGARGGAPALDRALDRLEELGVRILVEDLGAGSSTPANLSISAVAPVADVLGPGVPTEISVRVDNHGAQERTGVRVELTVDGRRQPTGDRIDVAARSSAEVVFRVVFKTPGPHAVLASLEGDRLSADDRFATVVDVPSPQRVLLVNGDPHPELDRDEVGYLDAILAPPSADDSVPNPASLFAPFLTTTIDATTFGLDDPRLFDYDVIVLANVGSLSERVVSALEQRVAAGGALLVTMGDNSANDAVLEAFNTRAWKADGTGLLPAKLFRKAEVRSRRSAYYRCAEFDETHPALEFFADERWRPFLTEVPIFAFVESQPIESARVLARLDDERKSPLLVEREYSRGRVFLWTTSIDADWNGVAESPSTLIPLVHELLRYAGRGRRPSFEAGIGESITLESNVFPRNVDLVRPDGSRRPLDGEPVEVTADLWTLPTIGPLDRAGPWRVEWDGGFLPFAVHLAAREGDLDRITPDELERAHGVWRIFDPSVGRVDDGDDASNRGELWRWLAALALACLMLETLWSAWIGRGRRLA